MVDEVVGLGVEGAAIVSHGAIIRAWVAARAVNLEPGFTSRTSVSNTGVVVLEQRQGRWVVAQWEDQTIGAVELNAADNSAVPIQPTSAK